MLKRFLAVSLIVTLLPGCNSLIASATGPEPLMAKPGERTFAKGMEDWSIEKTIGVNLLKIDPAFKQANITVTSFHGAVLLTGQVPTEALKEKATAEANSLAEVKQVHNELNVGSPTYYLSRASDSMMRTKVWSKMKFDNAYPSSRTEVVVENATVYIMGKLTPSEADLAVEKASSVAGVQRIVKLIDYLEETDTGSQSTTAPSE